MKYISFRLLSYFLFYFNSMMRTKSILIELSMWTAYVYMTSSKQKKTSIYFAATEVTVIVNLFIELKAWFIVAAVFACQKIRRDNLALWHCIIADSEILETAVSLLCRANTKAMPRSSTSSGIITVTHTHAHHRNLQSSTGGNVSDDGKFLRKEKKKHIYIFLQTDDFDRLRISLIARRDREER